LAALGWTGPPAIVAGIALRVLFWWLRRRRERRAAAAATKPAAPATPAAPAPATPESFQPSRDPNDYVRHWARHFQGTGGDLRLEAVRGPLYVEALALLRDGRITVEPTNDGIARGVAGYVDAAYTRQGELLPPCDLYDAAYVGWLYRDAVERLRAGLLRACGFREAAEAIHQRVAAEFVRQCHRSPEVSFLPERTAP
jgi:hypothetical protein